MRKGMKKMTTMTRRIEDKKEAGTRTRTTITAGTRMNKMRTLTITTRTRTRTASGAKMLLSTQLAPALSHL